MPAEIYPKVSVLVAARNEEGTVKDCLDALLSQNYKGEYEVLVGNDDSSDNTGNIIAEFAAKDSRVISVQIRLAYKGRKGKANVLAQLAAAADGDLFMVTDADAVTKPTWISEMVSYCLAQEVDMVNGVTYVEGDSWLAQFQNTDWLGAQFLLSLMSKQNLPVTLIGNNMLITRTAYEAVGGYEGIPFSVTEDHALFKAVRAKGFELRTHFVDDVLTKTYPVKTIAEWFTQRHRWLQGGLASAWYAKLVFFGYLIVNWAIVINAIVMGTMPSLIACMAAILATNFMPAAAFGRMGLNDKRPFNLYYPLMLIGYTLLVLRSPFVRKVKWKERSY